MYDFLMNWLAHGLVGATWWQLVLVTLITTHITIVAVTVYLHRAMAHRALDLHPVVSHFFRFWLWMSTGMVTREWTAIHRKHHAKCETVDDPHSPQIHGIRKLLLQGTELYRAESKNNETMEKFGHGTPDDWIERNVYSAHSIIGVYLTLAIDVILFGGIGLTIFAIQMLWIPVTAAGIINGLGHWWGYRNYNAPDASKNISPWGILIGGEELHNNHHTYPTSARLSNKWYEFDIGWMYIRILSMFGLATVKKVAPRPSFIAARPRVDLDALQAVIQYRYDVMATYARELRRTCAEEAARLKPTHLSASKLLVSARGWLHRDSEQLADHHRAKLGEVLAASDVVRKLIEMRAELSAIWGRSSESREQLVAQLQHWCTRAENSGVRALQEMSLRLRSYTIARS